MSAHGERRHPWLTRFRNYVIGFVATVVVIALAALGWFALIYHEESKRTAQRQAKLAPFYRLPEGWQTTTPGTVLRTERVGGVPAHGVGWRILYRTERADGSPAVSSGLIYAPTGPVPTGGRPVVAWAHGTVGMGDACAPSRTPTPASKIPGLGFFLSAGWVVAATDYAGLGTPGTEQYLVGGAAARDVLNSVRAARTMRGVGAGTRVALWGHSQGGHSVLWTQALAAQVAPELTVVGTAAAAPAAELPTLMSRQWQAPGGSLIGAEVLVGWPGSYPGLDVDRVWDSKGGDFRKLADRCIEAGLVDVEVRKLLGKAPLFRVNPMTVPAWRAAAEQAVPPFPTKGPTMIVQGLADPLVLPGTTAAYVEASCRAASGLTASFVGDLGHMTAGFAAAPIVFTWFQQRFAGIPAGSTCGTDLPVAPLGAGS